MTEVFFPRMTSSADSISNFPGLSGRVAVAINPSGAPVLKKVGSAAAAAAGSKPISAAEIASFACVLDITFLPATRPSGRGWMVPELGCSDVNIKFISKIE